ncbi:MAG: hypothetical protein V7L27_22465 [Nostoc sp.]|uniref:hypothetical protein n=1 Tax=Nostoc sp. TaxID=1180 RepID=UPI002FFB7247
MLIANTVKRCLRRAAPTLKVEASAANARRFSPSGQRLIIQDSSGLKQDVTSNEVRPVFVLSSASRYHSRSC